MARRSRFFFLAVCTMALVCFWGSTQTYLISLLLAFPRTPPGAWLQGGLARLGEALLFLYGASS